MEEEGLRSKSLAMSFRALTFLDMTLDETPALTRQGEVAE